VRAQPQPPGAPPPPRLLERAASKVADFTASKVADFTASKVAHFTSKVAGSLCLLVRQEMENIAAYSQGARGYGVPEPDVFVTSDLYEDKNFAAVVRNLHSLGRVAQQRGFDGPTLGARLASRNVRTFSQAQLDEAKAMPAKWTNRGDTQQEGQALQDARAAAKVRVYPPAGGAIPRWAEATALHSSEGRAGEVSLTRGELLLVSSEETPEGWVLGARAADPAIVGYVPLTCVHTPVKIAVEQIGQVDAPVPTLAPMLAPTLARTLALAPTPTKVVKAVSFDDRADRAGRAAAAISPPPMASDDIDPSMFVERPRT